LNKQQVYWLCQLGGWTAFVLFQIYFWSFNVGINASILINAGVNVVMGIGVTHAYRLVILRYRVLELPYRRMWPRVLLGAALMVTAMVAVNLPMDMAMFPEVFSKGITLRWFVQYVFNWSIWILFWTLLYHAFQFWDRSLRAETQRVSLEKQLKEVELNRLMNQLNPHFLFNTLNTIRVLVDVDPPAARDAVSRLSSLLRATLQLSGSRTVPLRQEVATLQDYLTLEKLRFEDRLNIAYDIAPDTLTCPVPPMMLQTLAENGLKHGIANLKQGGLLSIRSYLAGGQLHIEIRNTGQLTHQPDLFDAAAGSPATVPGNNQTQPAPERGIGVANTRQRLRLLYQNNAVFRLRNEDAHTVLTELILPPTDNPEAQPPAQPATSPNPADKPDAQQPLAA